MELDMKEFITKIFTSKSGISSKRVVGSIILITELIIIGVSTFCGLIIPLGTIGLHEIILWGGFGLLGIGLLEKAGSVFKSKDKKNEEL